MPARLATSVVLLVALGCSTGPPADAPVATAAPPTATAPAIQEPTAAPTAPTSLAQATPEASPSPLPAALQAPVTTLLPEIRVDLPAPVDADTVRSAVEVEGVTFATAVSLARVTFVDPDGRSIALRVAGIDPEGFRVLAPQISADDPQLWARILEGHMTVTHEAAEALSIELRTVLSAPGGPVAVGAIAANGQPPIADVLVDREVAVRMGIGEPSTLLVSVRSEEWPDEVAAELADVLGVAPTLIYGKPQRRIADLPDDTIWEALAMCESSGRWDIDSGNGYYGGLQFLPSSWHLVGGTGLPHEASRDEQIHRAELLLARQGWKAWPACSLRLGLREPDEDP